MSEEKLDGLERLSEDFAINVNPPGTITELSTGRIISDTRIGLELCNSTKYMTFDGIKDGKPMRSYPTWRTRCNSNRIQGQRIAPTQPAGRIYTDEKKLKWYNTYQGFPLNILKDVISEMPEAFQKLIFNLCGMPLYTNPADPDECYMKDYGSIWNVIYWLAYIVQNPGVKMATCVYIFSMVKGVGKSFLCDVMLTIFGRDRHGVELSSKDLFAEFNMNTESTLLCVTNELTLKEGFGVNNTSLMKDMITGHDKSVRIKYVQPYKVKDYANYMLTGNTPENLGELATDRRFIVHNVPGTARPLPKDVQDRIHLQVEQFFNYLLQLEIPSSFSHTSESPSSIGKDIAAEMNEDPLGQWIQDYCFNNSVFQVSAKQLAEAYNSDHERACSHVSSDRVSARMKTFGLRSDKGTTGKRTRDYKIPMDWLTEQAQEAASPQQSVSPESSKLADEEDQFRLG